MRKKWWSTNETTVIFTPNDENEEVFDYECKNCHCESVNELDTHCPQCGCKINWEKSGEE